MNELRPALSFNYPALAGHRAGY